MSLKQVAFKGASWTFIGSIATAVIQILRPAILTRYLEKSDFGVMAILMLVLGFTQIFSDLFHAPNRKGYSGDLKPLYPLQL